MYRTNACRRITVVALFIGSLTAQAQSTGQPEGFWASRDAEIETAGDANRVRIAIWDSGVDTSLFANQVARNADGGIVLRGYDAFKNRQDTAMAVLPEAVLKRQSELNEILLALDDRDSGVDSPAAKAIVERLKKQTPAEAAEFDDVVGRWSGYVHGTGVADIALAGKPSFPSGTSMATPVVVNAAAKVLAVNPRITGAELRALLERTATSNATGQPLLHPRKAVEAAQKPAGR